MTTRSPDIVRRERTLHPNPVHEAQIYSQNLAPPRVLMRKSSDKPEFHLNSHGNVNKDSNDHHQSRWDSIRKLTNTRVNQDASYDTDGGIRTTRQAKHEIGPTKSNLAHLVSPRLPLRNLESSASKPTQSWTTVNPWLFNAHSTANNFRNQRDETNAHNDDNESHRQLSTSRRVGSSGDQSSSHMWIRALQLPSISKTSTFRLIFLRHGERVNQVFGYDWFDRAFSNGTYHAFDHRLPVILPKRKFYQNFEFDVPLTIRGLKSARMTGTEMQTKRLIPDVCLSSSSLRCIQTCERVLTGMDLRERIPIRVEPGLFECPHTNHKLVDSFMTRKELLENRYNIKTDYKPLVSQLSVPESLDEYFDRCSFVMRGIIDRYGHHGVTVLIVTHAPALLALPDAVKGIRTNSESIYRNVGPYQTLAMLIAEFDGIKWRFSEQPFNLVSN